MQISVSMKEDFFGKSLGNGPQYLPEEEMLGIANLHTRPIYHDFR